MANVTFSTPINQQNDADFRAWGDELRSQLLACGLVQTADTGQMANPLVVSIPGSNNTNAGFWIFRFNDILQATAPIFIRIDIGRGGNAAVPRIVVSVGSGTDGAGVLSGEVFNQVITGTSTLSSSATPVPSYFTHSSGFFGMAYKLGRPVATGLTFLSIARTCDATGSPTDTGYFIASRNSSNTGSVLCASGSWTGYNILSTSPVFGLIPMDLPNSAVGADYQVFKCYGAYPEVKIVPQLVLVIPSELSPGSQTGPVEIIDGVFNNFICCGNPSSNSNAGNAASYLAMLWP